MPGKLSIVIVAACLCVAVAAPATAQRLSLGERISLLEQQAANSSGNVELLNQITQLRNELRDLRAQIEQLQRQQEQQAGRGRSQYLDLDSRLMRLEGGALVSSAAPTAAADGSESVTLEVPADSIDPMASVPPATVIRASADNGDSGDLAAGRNEQDDYLAAFDVLKAGDYVGSASAFQDFLQRHPGGQYAPNALYWLGESYYVTQNYALAQRQFQTLLDRYPTHDKAIGALLKVGLSQYGQDQFEAAAATLTDVTQRYPGSSEADTAADRLRAMQLPGAR